MDRDNDGIWCISRYFKIGNDIIEKDRVEIYECIKILERKMDQCLCRTKKKRLHTHTL
jgi:hypothetical protein